MRAFALLVLVVWAAPSVRAQVRLVPLVGYDFEHEAPTIGGGIEVGVTPRRLPVAVAVRPSVEVGLLGDDHDGTTRLWRVHGDLIGRFALTGVPIVPYAKVGIGAGLRREETPDTVADGVSGGLNLGLGAGVGRFLVEGTVGIGDIGDARIAFGYRY